MVVFKRDLNVKLAKQRKEMAYILGQNDKRLLVTSMEY
jgi:hypothetical protein